MIEFNFVLSCTAQHTCPGKGTTMQNSFIKQDAERSLHHSLLSLARVLLRNCLRSNRLSVHRGSWQDCFLNSGSNDSIPQLRHPPCKRGRRDRPLKTPRKFTKEAGLKTEENYVACFSWLSHVSVHMCPPALGQHWNPQWYISAQILKYTCVLLIIFVKCETFRHRHFTEICLLE